MEFQVMRLLLREGQKIPKQPLIKNTHLAQLNSSIDIPIYPMKQKYKTQFLIIFILLIGLVFRLLITSNGNFLFNMDNARDMLDVREMVVLHKLRLIGPTSGIAGIYTGP